MLFVLLIRTRTVSEGMLMLECIMITDILYYSVIIIKIKIIVITIKYIHSSTLLSTNDMENTNFENYSLFVREYFHTGCFTLMLL